VPELVEKLTVSPASALPPPSLTMAVKVTSVPSRPDEAMVAALAVSTTLAAFDGATPALLVPGEPPPPPQADSTPAHTTITSHPVNFFMNVLPIVYLN
jgi:hypothetical protein